MLPLPLTGSETGCIIGIDPGSETLGVGIIHFNYSNLQIVKCEAYTFFGSKLDGLDQMNETHGDRYQRIFRHQNNLLRLFHILNPVCVVYESAFINIKRPAAYGALTEVCFMIRQTAILYDPWLGVYTIEPSNVKKAIGALGNCDKSEVKNKLLQNKDLVSTCATNLSLLDEHSVDALCVAYAQYLKYQ